MIRLCAPIKLHVCGAMLAATLILPAIAWPAGKPAQPPSATESSYGELVLEGESGKFVERLTLWKAPAGTHNLVRPGPSVLLPPGSYRLVEIRLRGGYCTRPFTKEMETITISPGKPCRLNLGALRPSVDVQRRGPLLVLNCQLCDSAGRHYFDETRDNPPRFAVYDGDRRLFDDSFKYG